jgi:hypothetical protein
MFAYKFFSSQLALARQLPRPTRISLFLFFAAALADGVLMPFVWQPLPIRTSAASDGRGHAASFFGDARGSSDPGDGERASTS